MLSGMSASGDLSGKNQIKKKEKKTFDYALV